MAIDVSAHIAETCRQDARKAKLEALIRSTPDSISSAPAAGPILVRFVAQIAERRAMRKTAAMMLPKGSATERAVSPQLHNVEIAEAVIPGLTAYAGRGHAGHQWRRPRRDLLRRRA